MTDAPTDRQTNNVCVSVGVWGDGTQFGDGAGWKLAKLRDRVRRKGEGGGGEVVRFKLTERNSGKGGLVG